MYLVHGGHIGTFSGTGWIQLYRMLPIASFIPTHGLPHGDPVDPVDPIDPIDPAGDPGDPIDRLIIPTHRLPDLHSRC